jgi:hypothetical protein
MPAGGLFLENLMRRVIVRLRDGNLIRGFLPAPEAESLDEFLHGQPPTFRQSIDITPMESGENLTVSLDDLKAVFFVKTFNGRTDYQEIKFFAKTPPIRGVWVRVEFFDHECLEGVVENSLRCLVDPGFFMKPPDAQSNNEILYVIKSSLRDFRILGVRTEY